jgi:hypothetical protein
VQNTKHAWRKLNDSESDAHTHTFTHTHTHTHTGSAEHEARMNEASERLRTKLISEQKRRERALLERSSAASHTQEEEGGQPAFMGAPHSQGKGSDQIHVRASSRSPGRDSHHTDMGQGNHDLNARAGEKQYMDKGGTKTLHGVIYDDVSIFVWYVWVCMLLVYG